jgi:preprotein translocase subunit SecA
MSLLKALFGTKNDRDLKSMKPVVVQINALEPQIQKLSDQELQAQTPKLREQYQRLVESGKSNYDALWEILPEAFATVREASTRVMKMRHFDVQLMGGIVLFQRKIAEMKTGEGKTLTATLPCYLHGLSQLGAHVVTVNDYLAARDAREMGELYRWLGLSVGCILTNMSDEERQNAYKCDITYKTNNEFAFDYLRDNMKFTLQDYVQQKGHNFCIVDEVDSILIDEARTPLLISGPSEGNSSLYKVADQVVRKLEKDKHFKTDEKSHTAMFTDDGVAQVQELMKIDNLYSIQHSELLHHLYQSLKAHNLFKLDVNYVVKEGKVIIVDEFTGRLKEGSRWSDGLHQAVEAKEGVNIRSENQTLASITFQNYFKLYNFLAGMTGTAETEAEEFRKIYNLDVTSIPTNVAMIRDDQADVIYKSAQGKYKAIGKLIKELHAKGQPVLVGTISIENSEILSNLLTKEGIPHEVLNAKQHAREAEIVAMAGHSGKVTIATNMAGRGTDIKLTPDTKAAGGLFILGTERHESRRIDNQLRGRSGRQGDPGASKFFLSLEDDLMRIFGSDRIKGIMSTLGMEEDEPIEHRMITNAIAKAQKKVEAHNFEIRKHLLEYDNVMNEQRRVIYRIRREILADNDNFGFAKEMTEDVAVNLAETYRPERKTSVEMWPWEEMEKGFQATFQTDYKITAEECARGYDNDPANYFAATAIKLLEARFAEYPEDQVKMALKEILLSIFDQHWKEHLLAMDHVKEGINLRAYAQKDPLTEYKRESFNLFENMRQVVKKASVETLFTVKLYSNEEIEELQRKNQEQLEAQLAAHKEAQRQAEAAATAQASSSRPVARQVQKVGRNDVCPCGSGKKFKQCHGA